MTDKLSEMYELAILASLVALNEWKYPQAIIVVKESKLLKELSNFISKHYNYNRDALNCVNPTLSILFCTYSKLL